MLTDAPLVLHTHTNFRKKEICRLDLFQGEVTIFPLKLIFFYNCLSPLAYMIRFRSGTMMRKIN